MVVYNLTCDKEHRFEGWFGSAADFDAQIADGLVECPACGSSGVKRLPSASYVSRGLQRDNVAPRSHDGAGKEGQRQDGLEEAVRRVAGALEEAFRRSEDVGRGFAEEARRIHYREAPSRNIRGVASNREVAELRDEGIEVTVVPIPTPVPDNLH